MIRAWLFLGTFPTTRQGDWELWSGVPIAMSPSAKKRHQKICGTLHFALKSALQEQSCTDCEVYFELELDRLVGSAGL
jgi:hypothetical protein